MQCGGGMKSCLTSLFYLVKVTLHYLVGPMLMVY